MTSRREGAALIIVLLLVALLVVFSAEITVRSATDARMLENQLTEIQAQYGLQGALTHAIEVLRTDLKQDQQNLTQNNLPMADWTGETWAQPVSGLPLGDGSYGFSITDEQARYHINALVTGVSNDLVPLEQRRFERLLSVACPGIDTSAFRAALYTYLTNLSATRGPSATLLSTKELFMVPSATTEILLGPDGHSGLLPKLTRWTTGKVNVNTAPQEVLYAVTDRFDATAFNKLLQRIPLRTLDELWPILGYDPADPANAPALAELTAALSVRSTFFRVALSYTKGTDTRTATAIVKKIDGQPARLWWDPDPFFP